MCNHYQKHPEAIQSWADYVGWDLDLPFDDKEIDVWPKRAGLTIRVEAGQHIAENLNWGVPLTTAGKRPGTTVTKYITNVRNLKSSFWASMLSEPMHRCIVPFSSFAEPKPGKDPKTGRPAEYWFTVTGRPAAAFAGIWRPSQAGRVFAFLTCEPNSLVAPLHPKAMPVILNEDDYNCWLTADWVDAQKLAAPFPAQLMAVR